MILLLSVFMIISSIDDLRRIKRQYISYKAYSIFYIIGTLMALSSWLLIAYSAYSNEKNIIFYFMPLFLIGYTLFYKGLYNLDKFLEVNTVGMKIHKKGYKLFIILDIFCVFAGIFLYLIKAKVLT